MIRLNVWVIGLKNYKSKTEPIIIGLVWFYLENESIALTDSNQFHWFGLVWIFGFIESIRFAYTSSLQIELLIARHSRSVKIYARRTIFTAKPKWELLGFFFFFFGVVGHELLGSLSIELCTSEFMVSCYLFSPDSTSTVSVRTSFFALFFCTKNKKIYMY